MTKEYKADGNAPGWADTMLNIIADDLNREDMPVLAWRRSAKSNHSSGTTWHANHHGLANGEPACRIVITAGKSNTDAYMVLLHEIAHWVVGNEHHHDEYFWEWCWYLYIKYGVPLTWAYLRESRYKKTAMFVAEKKITFSPQLRLAARAFWDFPANRKQLPDYDPARFGAVTCEPMQRFCKN